MHEHSEIENYSQIGKLDSEYIIKLETAKLNEGATDEERAKAGAAIKFLKGEHIEEKQVEGFSVRNCSQEEIKNEIGENGFLNFIKSIFIEKDAEGNEKIKYEIYKLPGLNGSKPIEIICTDPDAYEFKPLSENSFRTTNKKTGSYSDVVEGAGNSVTITYSHNAKEIGNLNRVGSKVAYNIGYDDNGKLYADINTDLLKVDLTIVTKEGQTIKYDKDAKCFKCEGQEFKIDYLTLVDKDGNKTIKDKLENGNRNTTGKDADSNAIQSDPANNLPPFFDKLPPEAQNQVNAAKATASMASGDLNNGASSTATLSKLPSVITR